MTLMSGWSTVDAKTALPPAEYLNTRILLTTISLAKLLVFRHSIWPIALSGEPQYAVVPQCATTKKPCSARCCSQRPLLYASKFGATNCGSMLMGNHRNFSNCADWIMHMYLVWAMQAQPGVDVSS